MVCWLTSQMPPYTLQWVIMSSMASPISSLTIACWTVYSVEQTMKAPCHWPLCVEFAGDRGIPRKKASNVEYVSTYWFHYVRLWLRCAAHCSYVWQSAHWKKINRRRFAYHNVFICFYMAQTIECLNVVDKGPFIWYWCFGYGRISHISWHDIGSNNPKMHPKYSVEFGDISSRHLFRNTTSCLHQWPLLLTWFCFNPSMDMQLDPL